LPNVVFLPLTSHSRPIVNRSESSHEKIELLQGAGKIDIFPALFAESKYDCPGPIIQLQQLPGCVVLTAEYYRTAQRGGRLYAVQLIPCTADTYSLEAWSARRGYALYLCGIWIYVSLVLPRLISPGNRKAAFARVNFSSVQQSEPNDPTSCCGKHENVQEERS
jgi:hypothetical protein